jgi:hypothetical protein
MQTAKVEKKTLRKIGERRLIRSPLFRHIEGTMSPLTAQVHNPSHFVNAAFME